MIVTENITLDGVIEAADWFSAADDEQVDQSDLVAELQAQSAASDSVLLGRVTEVVTAIKAEQGRDIVATGSITLVHALIAADLVDEFRLFVYPAVVGEGARLFLEATNLRQLRLVEARPFRSGVVLLRYRPH
ncbi:dihydrofolate reductase family protein [Nocardia sp. GCM10030253]|uniref:dihydrofolate reductase family protein n=1 Tax=Nocardia sp. GCM10030253 TaxID=3273404 RepID=UPI00363AFEEE